MGSEEMCRASDNVNANVNLFVLVVVRKVHLT